MIRLKSMRLHISASYFFYSLLSICIFYLLFEAYHIPYWTLATDEFVFARHIYEYTFHVPYQDFPPYKTVLGYYLLSIPMFFSHSLLTPLFYIKNEIAIINMLCIVLTSYWAIKFFDKRAVLLALLAVLANQLFLVYGTDLRVDMLTSWACLFATFCILQNRTALAGMLLGIAFLISQKALWYFFAINAAMVLCWIRFASPLYTWRSLFSFNLATISTIAAYILFWSIISNPSIVLYNLFYEAYIQATIDWYEPIYQICWQITLCHGPLLFLLWPFTFISLFDKYASSHDLQKRTFIISFASITLLLFIRYKQPFPYNFVFTVPAFFFLYAEFISWLLLQKKCFTQNIDTTLPSLSFIFTLAAYCFCLYAVITLFALPTINIVIILIPLITTGLLYSWGHHPRFQSFCLLMALSLFTIMGILYPFAITWNKSHHMNGAYQQTMIRLTDQLIANDGSYIGGIPFLYEKDQPIDGLKNLISPALEYLYTPTDRAKSLLLPSLYLTPTTVNTILNEFENKPIKVIVSNYRMNSLPPKLLHYIEMNYAHFYGSVYLYAPTILPTQLSFYLKFSGHYRLVTTSKAHLLLDGKKIRSGKIIFLKQGDHTTDARYHYRLVFLPELMNESLNPAYQKDHDEKMINPIMT